MGLFSRKKNTANTEPGTTTLTDRLEIVEMLNEVKEGETLHFRDASDYEGEHKIASHSGDRITLDSDAGGRVIKIASGTVHKTTREGDLSVGFGIQALKVWR